jgi:hypothetical protein
MARKNRAAGTGSIVPSHGRFYAYAPGTADTKGPKIGNWYGSRYQAERALEKWLKENASTLSVRGS